MTSASQEQHSRYCSGERVKEKKVVRSRRASQEDAMVHSQVQQQPGQSSKENYSGGRTQRT